MIPRRFRIAFSFAGEKRPFVKEVADLLAARFSEAAILYDKYHEAEFARRDLGIYLPELYHKHSDLVVVVVCPDYDVKQWTGLEWTAIHDLLSQRKHGEVMLCRFERATVPGLYSTAGFIELDHKSPQQAADLILERLALNEGKSKDHYVYTIPACAPLPMPRPFPIPVTNNLPRLISFHGRQAELDIMAKALLPQTRTWGVLIDGPGGMGKTSLAVKAAELAASQFERVLFVSTKSQRLTPEGAVPISNPIIPACTEMLNQLASLLGLPHIAERAESERPALIKQALDKERTLLILDNLENLDKSQLNLVFEFLADLPGTSKAIVTSRRRTDVEGRIIRLEKLDPDAALACLEELATDRPLLRKSSPEDRLHLYEETGGNPLLLRWVVGQLGIGSCRDIAGALALCRAAAETNDPLEFIFGDLLETFTEAETKSLAALTYFTHKIEVKFIAALAGLSPTAARTALGDLSNRALVIPDEAEENFALVPMVADFLRKRRPEAVREAGNLLEQLAYATIVNHGGEKYDRFPVLDAAWPIVDSALSIFLTGTNGRLQTVCAALQFFLEFTGRWDEWLAITEQAEAMAVAAGDYDKAGARAVTISYIQSLRKSADGVLASTSRAVDHWLKANVGARKLAIAIRARGLGHELRGDYQAAIAAYNESLKLMRSLSKHGPEEAMCLNSLAVAMFLSGDFENAERNYHEGLEIAQLNESADQEATILGNLAQLRLAQERWADAETVARQSCALAEKIGRQELIALGHHHVGKALKCQNKADEALSFARKAVEIYSRLGSPNHVKAETLLRECLHDLAAHRLTPGWTYNTTTLEGSTLSVDEVTRVIRDSAAELPARPAADIAANRANEAAKLWMLDFLKEDKDWTKADLFQLHTLLMQGSLVDIFKPVGAWKKEDNFTTVKVAGKTTLNNAYGPAIYVHSLMEQWLTHLNRCRRGDSADPFQDYLWLHATFARIHPFADGNGRMARLLANIPLLAAGLYPVDIPAAARDRYLESLASWQIACGAPDPGGVLYDRPELLAGFTALCQESHPEHF